MNGPIPSPKPPAPADDEPGTDPNALVTTADLRSANALTRYLGVGLAFLFSGGAGSCGVVSALSMVRSEARAQATDVTKELDAGQKGLAVRVDTLEQQRKDDRTEQGNRMDRIEQNQNADHGLILGVSQKLDVILKAQGIPNPAPTPKGGSK